jgi:hypothetical protein
MNSFRFYRRRRRLRNTRLRIGRHYEKEYQKAHRENKPREEIDDIAAIEDREISEVSDEIQALESSHYLDVAEKYGLPTPPFDRKSGAWEKSEFTERMRLSVRILIV